MRFLPIVVNFTFLNILKTSMISVVKTIQKSVLGERGLFQCPSAVLLPSPLQVSIYLSLYCHVLLFIPNTARMTLPQDKEIMLLLCSRYSKSFPSYSEWKLKSSQWWTGLRIWPGFLKPLLAVSRDSSPGSLVLSHPGLCFCQISSHLGFLAFAILSSWGVSSRDQHDSFPYFLQGPF